MLLDGAPCTHATGAPNTFVAGNYVSYVSVLLLFVGAEFGGIWYVLPAVFIMLIIPILDAIFGDYEVVFDDRDFTAMQRLALEAAPAGFILLYALAIARILSDIGDLDWIEFIIVTYSVGSIGSIAIAAAHELVHKTSRISRWIGRLGLLFVGYNHFEIAHIKGHHIRSCTTEDKSTGWYDESAIWYVIRTIPQCAVASWKLEKNMYVFVAPILLALAILYFFGLNGLIFWAVQALIAVVFLEVVSYIEHYGLLRERREDGKWSRQTPAHSWNAYQMFSSFLTFNLQRHADHHTSAMKPYYLLKTDEAAPRLPFGYPTMITIALIPPLWRYIIHPILEEHRKRFETAVSGV